MFCTSTAKSSSASLTGGNILHGFTIKAVTETEVKSEGEGEFDALR